MVSKGENLTVQNWLSRSRNIEWSLTLGLSSRRRANLQGSFNTTLSYLDDQGEKWGDTYIKIVGQHYDDYAHWNAVSTLLPIGGINNRVPTFVPQNFVNRVYKGAAPGVTGLIGEVLITVFLQKVLKVQPFEIAHLLDNRKAPDICLDIAPSIMTNLFRTSTNLKTTQENNRIINELNKVNWNEPLPLECKSRRENGDRQVRSALTQLISYWRSVPSMAGYGIFAQIDIEPDTKIRIHLLAPKNNEVNNVRQIITGNISNNLLPALSAEPTYFEFNSILGGRLIG